uniref:SAM domain-containing protein n=1 Tax=Photinus pyralis TaxID=7054 RepID=A0A1Y1KMF2_PHOPY
MADEDVVAYLHTWGLPQYVDVFKQQNVKKDTLPFLTPEMVKELIPPIGDRAQFQGHLDHWKMIINEIPQSSPLPVIPGAAEIASTSWATEDYLLEDISGNNIPLSGEPLNPTEPEGARDLGALQEQRGDILKLLHSCNDGRALLVEAKETGCLTGRGRRTLQMLHIFYSWV